MHDSKPLDQIVPDRSDRSIFPPSSNQAVSQAVPARPRRRSAVGGRLRTRASLNSDQASRETFWMQTDPCLDLASLDKIQQAIRAARLDQHMTERVVIDMEKTCHVFDSGLELLLFLYRRSGTLRDKLYIVNASAGVRERLGEKGLDACFHLRARQLN